VRGARRLSAETSEPLNDLPSGRDLLTRDPANAPGCQKVGRQKERNGNVVEGTQSRVEDEGRQQRITSSWAA
jgi:hypothetical protein